jgi:hypothetical protein
MGDGQKHERTSGDNLPSLDSTDCRGLPCNSADPESPVYCDGCVGRLEKRYTENEAVLAGNMEPLLQRLNMEHGHLEMYVKGGWVAMLMAGAFREMLGEAKNFVELEIVYDPKKPGEPTVPMNITVCRRDGKRPSHMIKEAEAKIAEAREAWIEVRSYCVAGSEVDHEKSCEAAQPYKGECDCFVPALDAALSVPR